MPTLDEFTSVPLSRRRKMIATRTAEAKRNIPHYRLRAEIPAQALLDARERWLQERQGLRITINDMIVKACGMSLRDVPEVNVQWHDDVIHRFQEADISVVIAGEDGPVAPVLRAVERKSVWAVAEDIRSFAERARSNKLTINDLTGGTLGVSNLGMHDILDFDAVINPPQCAILAVGAVTTRPGMSAAGMVVSTKAFWVTLALDHRAIDGAQGARFMSAFRHYIVEPDAMR